MAHELPWWNGTCSASLVIAVGFVKAFTSAIVSPDVLALATFPLAVSAGAAGWVILASLTGLPVSTTHALTGAIVGVALVAGDVASVRWWMLLTSIAAPLALSPLASAGTGYGAHTLPVSTTHVATGAIVGAGIRQGSGAVQWGRVSRLVGAWIVTPP